jgi:hypothetical protein
MVLAAFAQDLPQAVRGVRCVRGESFRNVPATRISPINHE